MRNKEGSNKLPLRTVISAGSGGCRTGFYDSVEVNCRGGLTLQVTSTYGAEKITSRYALSEQRDIGEV